ncbi:hypothetical protein EVAR_74624_1 [Eumeta japonica]|uniref:Uncharacterized protein n=1 Tax=Eumeta variegata TaxID=151549 RepID=A0A4C1WCB7_EUMVA|nr:hypothetical protein EVAR_74624_1 [Eumeta japonica]
MHSASESLEASESLKASVKMVCHPNQPFSIMERKWRSALGLSFEIPKSKIILGSSQIKTVGEEEEVDLQIQLGVRCLIIGNRFFRHRNLGTLLSIQFWAEFASSGISAQTVKTGHFVLPHGAGLAYWLWPIVGFSQDTGWSTLPAEGETSILWTYDLFPMLPLFVASETVTNKAGKGGANNIRKVQHLSEVAPYQNKLEVRKSVGKAVKAPLGSLARALRARRPLCAATAALPTTYCSSVQLPIK